jgi:hypothetical protein
MSGTVRRWAATALVALAAFGGAFAIARVARPDDPRPPPPPAERSQVTAPAINNLERAPRLKPLRTAPGGPAPTTATIGQP